MDRSRGFLLIASPHLPDPNFYRSVVLMIEHIDDGALGIVLNRESHTTLKEVWQEVNAAACKSDASLYVGGPVDGPLMALHTDDDLDGIEVIPNVYFTSDKATLEALVEQDQVPFQIFSGYAGWGPGQLDAELEMGGWLVKDARREHLFLLDPDALWAQVTHEIGEEITQRAFKIRHVPADPRSN